MKKKQGKRKAKVVSPKMSKIYIFSGLGSDKRAFGSINFKGLDVEFMKWLTPKKEETLESYAQRYTSQIKAKNPILIGLSFGGVLSIEIAKKIKVEKVILLASIKTKNEQPKQFQRLLKLAINYVVPTSLLNRPNFVMERMFGVKEKEDKELLSTILKDTDVHFIKWALNEIINWENKEVLSNIVHIHGDKDKIFPIKNCSPDYIVNGGGHSFTITHSKEVEKIIKMIC